MLPDSRKPLESQSCMSAFLIANKVPYEISVAKELASSPGSPIISHISACNIEKLGIGTI